MELRQLRYFVEIARCRNFSRAAENIHVAQSALSYQIAQLESDLGVSLFHRLPRGVELTESGAAFLPRAISLLRQAEDARTSLQTLTGTPAGRVRFGISPSVSDILALPLLQRVRSQLPQVELLLQEEITGTLRAHLMGGLLDIALLTDDGSLTSLACTPLVREHLYVIGRPDFLGGTSLDSLEFSKAVQLPLLLPDREQGVRPLVESLAQQQGLALPNIAAEVNSIAILKSMLLAGIGLTIQSPAAFRGEVKDGLLAHALITEPSLDRKWVICCPRDVPPSIADAAVAEVAVAVVSDLVRTGQWANGTLPNQP